MPLLAEGEVYGIRVLTAIIKVYIRLAGSKEPQLTSSIRPAHNHFISKFSARDWIGHTREIINRTQQHS